MDYSFKGTLFKGDVLINDKGVTIGKNFYPIDEIASAYLTDESGKGACMGTLYVNGSPVKFSYKKADKQLMSEAISKLRQIIDEKTNLPIINNTQDVIAYCRYYGFDKGLTDKWMDARFAVHFDMMREDERVLLPFVGYHNFKTIRNCMPSPYTLTNKRLLYTKQKVTKVEVVPIDLADIREVLYVEGNNVVSIRINSLVDRFTVGIDRDVCLSVLDKFKRIIDAYKEGKLDDLINKAISELETNKAESGAVNTKEDANVYNKAAASLMDSGQEAKLTGKSTHDAANDLREYKKLLDEGIISQEDFDKKKKELLDL